MTDLTVTDLLHQPVRWRIVQALIGRSLTTRGLAEQLPEIPATTLYRHVAVLVKAGVLVVTAEERVRGAVERTYELSTVDDPGILTHDGLRTMFTVFLAGLGADADRYLARDVVDPVADGVSFRQAALWLSDTEVAELAAAIQEALTPFLAHGEGAGRTRRLLSTVFMPER